MTEWFYGLSMDVRLALFILGCLLVLGVLAKVGSRSSRRPFDF